MTESKKKRSRRTEWPELPQPLPGQVVDNHTHLPVLDASDEPVDPADSGLLHGVRALSTAEQVERAAAVGVTRMITVGCSLPELAGSVAMAHEHPAIAVALAIHPNEVAMHAGVREVAADGLDPDERPHHTVPLDDAIARVAELARDERVVAIGETGLDLFRTSESGLAAQRRSFRAHIALAKELGLPLQIHDRDAHAQTVEVLLADGAPERTVFHCFSGDVELAQVCARHGWYASVAGPVTFPKNEDLRAAIAAMPRELLLLETDAPYLTPQPYRGRPNAPYLAALTMLTLAEMHDMDLAEACAQVWRNSEAVYGTW